MNKINQSHDINSGPTFKCIRFASNFTTKIELTTHIKEKHKIHMPCDYFMESRCELDNDCKSNHVKLAQGKQICYTCGDCFQYKRELILALLEDAFSNI